MLLIELQNLTFKESTKNKTVQRDHHKNRVIYEHQRVYYNEGE